MIETKSIRIRDPFVLPVPEQGLYYLFGSTDDMTQAKATGFDCYRSTDLENWEGPIPAFRPQPGFWSDRDYWAPEVHDYGGRYYMFATFKADGLHRGTQILVSDSPEGPFRPHSDGPVTPRDWECLDGTLSVDDDGAPWMVFCHEWVQVHDGEMQAIRLTPDLAGPLGEPVPLFKASEAPWTQDHPGKGNFVTDGPFLFHNENGALLMTWSSFTGGRYAIGVARSSTGKVTGPWAHDKLPIYTDDGGHAMLFRTFDGALMLAFHAPNRTPDERPVFLEVSGKMLETIEGGE